jgi:branched-chain amino acid transport system ATP-binding protein
MSLLALEKLEVAYGGIRAVKGIDLEVAEGEMVCLIGANGAGKSTTLRAVTGLVRAAAGRIRYDGQEIGGLRVHEIARRGLAMVPEGRGVFPQLTIEENLGMGAYARSDRAAVKADQEHAYHLFPRLAERRAQTAGTLSGGEQQMLAIARALVRDPKIILLDEPFEGLAPLIVKELMGVCRDLAASGQTIVLVEQNIAAMLALAHRAYMINNGHVVHERSVDELKAQPEILHRFLGV